MQRQWRLGCGHGPGDCSRKTDQQRQKPAAKLTQINWGLTALSAQIGYIMP